jgi:hypothetical protein
VVEITEAMAAKVLEVVDCGLSHGLGKPEPGYLCVEAAVAYAMGEGHTDKPSCVAPAVRHLKIVLNDAKWWQSNESRAKGLRRLALAQLGTVGTLDEREFAERVSLVAVRVMVPRALRYAAECHPDAEHRAKLEAAAKECEKADNQSASEASLAAAWSAALAAAAAAASSESAAAAARAAARAAAWAAGSSESAWSSAAWASSAESAAWAAAWASESAAAAARAARAAEQELCFFAEQVVQVLVEMGAPGTKWLFLTETEGGVT